MTKKEQALIEQYAKSLVEVVNEHGLIVQLKEDVIALIETIEASHLDRTLSSLAVPQGEKANLIRLLKDTDSIYLNNFLEVIIQNNREAYLYDMLQEVLKMISQVTNEYDVKVTSIVPLTEDQKSRVRTIVKEKFGLNTDRLIEIIDTTIIGGFIIDINNNVIDASIKHQLQEFKTKLN